MAGPTFEQALQLASEHQRAGRWPEAESIYRQILAEQPNHPETLHHLGILLYRSGRLDDAAASIRQAIAADSSVPRYHCNLGAVLSAADRTEQAMAAYRQALALKPDYADAYYNLGNLLRRIGRDDDAIAAYRQTVSIMPQSAEAWINLANLLRLRKEYESAIGAYQRAIALRPDLAEAHHNLANALLDTNQTEPAIAEYRLAISLRPDSAEGYCDLANALRRKGDAEESEAAARRAIELRPGFADGYNALGNAMLDVGRIDEAIAAYREGIEIAPDYALLHANLSLTLLLRGVFHAGWIEHEWRLRAPELGRVAESFAQPTWDGSHLNGRTIMLHAEQAFGDTIQFARYAPLVADRGGKVILKCHRELVRLMKTLPGPIQVIGRGEPMPAFDVHCPLMSLPCLFDTALETIPATIPYLRAEPELSAQWRQRLSGTGFKVGLVWAGRRNYGLDRKRSISPNALRPLLQVKGVTWLSLQKNQDEGGRTTDRGDQAATADVSSRFIDWTSELHDFADTAALIENLDLIIAVDTAVAHLSGALGKPVWVFIPFVPDWRWMLNRGDSSWYPTMRLFRQPRPGDWETPIGDLAKRLANLTLGNGGSHDVPS